MLHERFDGWLDRLEEAMKEPKPTPADLTEVVLSLRQELTQSMTEALVESRYTVEKKRETVLCPAVVSRCVAVGRWNGWWRPW